MASPGWFMLMRGPQDRAGHVPEAIHVTRGLGLEPHDISMTSGEKRKLQIESYGQGLNPACLCHETPIKSMDTEA